MKRVILTGILLMVILIPACADTSGHSRGVYMLLDTSGTYAKELDQAQAIINYLLGTLQPGDSLAVARIDTGSFSEKDIVAKVTFDKRPSTSNSQKRAFRQKVDHFIETVKSSSYTDITGGVLQASEYLDETGAAKKHILIFFDLKEDLQEGYIRDISFQLERVGVTALNVTKLRSDNIDPREYLKRLETWRGRVESGGGRWKVINDLERLDRILEE